MSRSLTTRAAVLACGPLAALALAACGGSGSSSPTTAAGPVGAAGHHHGRREHGRRGHHAHGHAARAHGHGHAARAAKAKPVVAHGSTAKFSQAATGRSTALKQLAASVLGATTKDGKSPRFHYRKTSTTTTETAFASQADGICSGYRSSVRGIAAHATNLASQENEMENLVNATKSALGQLQALTPPASQAGLASQYISLVGSSVSDFVLAQTRSTSLNESVGTQQELTDMNYANTSSQDATSAKSTAQKLGFKVCGSAGAEWL